jgi:hypothetical protein
MKLPRPCFTVRWLMIAVAIVAVVIGGWLWGERRRLRFADLEYTHKIQGIPVLQDGYEQQPSKFKNYHLAMAEKYRFAARYPWLPVAVDPPEPPDDTEWLSNPDEPRQGDRPAVRSSYGLIVMPPKIENGAP